MARRLKRRQVLSVLGLGAAAAVGGCTYSMTRPVMALGATSASAGPTSVQVSRRIRLHMFQTGWVAVKREHKSFSGPSALRFPAIMASRNWTEWMPVAAFAIEHPEGLFMVDTGETADILEPDYTACDPGTGVFYGRNLQFAISASDEIGPQLRAAGLDPGRVSKVVMTHLHSDHMGGMRHFPGAEFLISARASQGHTGALMCRIPSGAKILPVSVAEEPTGVFGQSARVTQDGSVRIVPTPGHADGHQSVMIEDDGVSICIVGDAAFSLDQIITEEMGGIVANVQDTRRSALALKQQYNTFGTVMLPTHDPDNTTRLLAV